MKATGIVRRIDELGRVVIPKEIRKTLRMNSGDPIEIYTERTELILKKYSPIKSVDGFASVAAEAVRSVSGHAAAICDTDCVSAVSGGQKSLAGERISPKLEKILRDKTPIIINYSDGGEAGQLTGAEEKKIRSEIIVPVLSDGDVVGGCILFSYSETDKMRESDLKIALTCAEFISRGLSE